MPVALTVFVRQLSGSLSFWMQKREEEGVLQGLWEFPGGKIEAGESPKEAAQREVLEEVGISIEPPKPFGTYHWDGGGRQVSLFVHLFRDEVSLPISAKQKWFTLKNSSPLKGLIPGINHQIIDDIILKANL